MKKYRKSIVAIVTGLALSSAYASVNHTPTQLVDLACPNEWKNLDIVIDPASVTWGNTADKEAFHDYQRAYFIAQTKSWGGMDNRYADDALTVASECALRKNIVVDNYFNKPIDITTTLKKRINIVPLIMSLLFD